MVNLKQTHRLERWTLYRAGGDFSLEPAERFGQVEEICAGREPEVDAPEGCV